MKNKLLQIAIDLLGETLEPDVKPHLADEMVKGAIRILEVVKEGS